MRGAFWRASGGHGLGRLARSVLCVGMLLSMPVVAQAEEVNIAAEVYFDVRGSKLSKQGKAVLDQWLLDVKGVKPAFILSIGHADPGEASDEAKAVKLSEARAAAVQAYLASKGFQPGQVHVEGKGDTQPVSASDAPAERARNRRVDVGMVGQRE
jgi:OOP family OmpA-OmpF porin